MIFKDRDDAATRLAERLARYGPFHPLTLGIPRGGVVMARAIADALGGELDVVLVRKISAPFDPELAVGSVGELGDVYLADHAGALGVTEAYLKKEVAAQRELLRRRREFYSPVHAPIAVVGRVAIIVDDGVATGSTMIAALRFVRAGKPARLVAATAVAPGATVRRLQALADEVVCLETPIDFGSVSEFFKDFSAVTDEEVIDLLAARPAKGGRHELRTPAAASKPGRR